MVCTLDIIIMGLDQEDWMENAAKLARFIHKGSSVKPHKQMNLV